MAEANEPREKRGGAGKVVGWGLVVIVVLLSLPAMCSTTTEDTNTPIAADGAGRADAVDAPTVEPVRVSNAELWSAYQANEVAAKARFGDKPLLVTGTIRDIGLDVRDEPFVTFESENRFMATMADLSGEDEAKIAALAKGQSIEVSCAGATEVASRPLLRDCRLR